MRSKLKTANIKVIGYKRTVLKRKLRNNTEILTVTFIRRNQSSTVWQYQQV